MTSTVERPSASSVISRAVHSEDDPVRIRVLCSELGERLGAPWQGRLSERRTLGAFKDQQRRQALLTDVYVGATVLADQQSPREVLELVLGALHGLEGAALELACDLLENGTTSPTALTLASHLRPEEKNDQFLLAYLREAPLRLPFPLILAGKGAVQSAHLEGEAAEVAYRLILDGTVASRAVRAARALDTLNAER